MSVPRFLVGDFKLGDFDFSVTNTVPGPKSSFFDVTVYLHTTNHDPNRRPVSIPKMLL